MLAPFGAFVGSRDILSCGILLFGSVLWDTWWTLELEYIVYILSGGSAQRVGLLIIMVNATPDASFSATGAADADSTARF